MKISNGVKKFLPIVIIILLIAGAAFYGGMKYGESKSTQGSTREGSPDFSNLSAEERQQRFQDMGGDNRVILGSRGNGFVTGEIISKDDKSITVKLPDGGSKIIFYSDSTEISKFTSGVSGDLEVGKTVVINGTTNQDGSITAKNIQIRP